MTIQRCRFSCTSRPMRTPETSSLKWRFAYLPPWNSASQRPRLPISWSLLDEWADAMQNCEPRFLQLSVCPAVAKLKLGQKCYGNGYLGQTETPRREAWSFVFPRCRSHFQSGLASGLEKLAPCRLIGVRGKTSDEGFMGARRSTATGSARWFLYPTNTWSHRF